jgi:hypothetical protein
MAMKVGRGDERRAERECGTVPASLDVALLRA